MNIGILGNSCGLSWKASVILSLMLVLTPFNIFSESLAFSGAASEMLADSIPLREPLLSPAAIVVDSISAIGDSLSATVVDTVDAVNGVAIQEMQKIDDDEFSDQPMRVFNPDPVRAVWLSALFPGLGQLYNRRYWKLPLVVGGFMGLGYGTSWNNMMLRDYTRAYNDLLDNDPTTKSYMDFFPPTTQEGSLDKTWLSRLLKSRKDYYRRNRDLCIISMVGVYLLAMVDAYVDASLAHFDISPDLSMQLQPAVIPDTRSRIPGLGLQWALTF